jgi:hypothetical protein
LSSARRRNVTLLTATRDLEHSGAGVARLLRRVPRTSRRFALYDSPNDLTEEEARRRLVPSKTTLLGLVKHATLAEAVLFDQAVTGRDFVRPAPCQSGTASSGSVHGT